jgi:predicted secreted protein
MHRELPMRCFAARIARYRARHDGTTHRRHSAAAAIAPLATAPLAIAPLAIAPLAIAAWLGGLAAIAPAQAETLLHLSDSETVTVMPDELSASLGAEASSSDPADAQQRVNADMADALAHARKVAAVTASTGAYNVWHVGPSPQDSSERWQASQALELSSHDAAALLTLVGQLQHNGMTINTLGWRLSRDAERHAHDDAMRQALGALRSKAEEAAGLLALRFDAFRAVRLDANPTPPMPRFVGAMAAMAAPTPPSAVATGVPVSATVEADIALLPKR